MVISRQVTLVLVLINTRESTRELGAWVYFGHSYGRAQAALLHRRDEMHTGPVVPGHSYRHQRTERLCEVYTRCCMAIVHVFRRPVYAGFLAAIIITAITGCASIPPLWQRNIGDTDLPASDGPYGIVVGSVSAPPVPYGRSPAPDTAFRYHRVVKFYFRSRVRGGEERRGY